MKKVPVTLSINGQQYSIEVPANARLIDTLRDDLRLTGTKEGCGVGECGACSVIVNGELVNSCLVLAAQCQDAKIETVEGLMQDGQLHALQQAFIDHHAVQCGYCSPGMLMAAKAILEKKPQPSRAEIKEGLSGVLCRCTGYQQIIEAVESVAKKGGK